MIQIGKSEDSSNIYLSFCIKKESLDNESIEVITSVSKQILNSVSNIIDEVTKNLRHDSSNTSYYMNKLKNYSIFMDVINSASEAIKESMDIEEEEKAEEV